MTAVKAQGWNRLVKRYMVRSGKKYGIPAHHMRPMIEKTDGLFRNLHKNPS